MRWVQLPPKMLKDGSSTVDIVYNYETCNNLISCPHYLAIGFGTKEIFGHQISGMVILFSRPFRHGDVINIDGTDCTVEEIGMRATRTLSSDGVEIMVPNSYFMGNKIVNYTKSEPMTRANFRVRVAGDCNPKEVEAIMAEEVKKYRHSDRNLEPFVVLADFSLRSIDFDIYYWLNRKEEDQLRISSRFRGDILQKLREYKIMAYDPHERVMKDKG